MTEERLNHLLYLAKNDVEFGIEEWEMEELAVLARKALRAEGLPMMEVLREKIGQAAYEWQQYVDTDHAPRNLVDHMEAAFDAATKGPNGG